MSRVSRTCMATAVACRRQRNDERYMMKICFQNGIMFCTSNINFPGFAILMEKKKVETVVFEREKGCFGSSLNMLMVCDLQFTLVSGL